MDYSILKYLHVLGAVLMGAGLIGVWLADLRSRQHHDLIRFSEAVRYIAVFYDGVVVPGALILLFSGTWVTIQYYGGWDFLNVPWLTGMIALFVFEFIEGNTITRLYFMKLRRLTNEALSIGKFTPELENERDKLTPSFTHYLDLPMLFLIIALGVIKPDTWEMFLYGSLIAIALAVFFTILIPRIYPWGIETIKIEKLLPLLENILGDWQETIGKDYEPYKNHVYRVVNFCLALHPCKQDDQEKFIIAGCFHDLGMWSNNTVDYLPPSVELAKQYLKENNQQRWSTEIELMIDQHHKVTRYRDNQYPLVEIFRKADWVDVSMGLRASGLAKKDVQLVLDSFPNLGFHKNLVKLAKAEFMKHPLNCMPMMKW